MLFCCAIVLSCWFVSYICIMHIASVHISYVGWISSVHTTKCIVGVHLFYFLFDILAWAFMCKLPMKLQPLKTSSINIYFMTKSQKGMVLLVAIFMLIFFLLFVLLWNINMRLWTQFWHKKTLHFNQEKKEML